jgi:Ni/Fe-hydrogenase 1 B-type cytochrome subunit
MRTFSSSFRLWHWLTAFSMIGIIITVVLRKTVMHKEQIGSIVQIKLAELGTVITDEQAVMIGKAVRSPMWDWHIYLGITIAVLLIWRLAMVVKNGFGFDDNPQMQKVYRLYQAVYVLLLASSISGLVLYYKLAGESKELVEGIHENVGYAIFVFVVVHIIGVIIAERSEMKGLISRMIRSGE